MKAKKAKKASVGAICLRVFIVLVIIVALVLLGGRLWFRLPIQDYYRISTPALPLPGLLEGYIPQGLAYLPENDQLLLTGYMIDKSASPLYLVDRSSGKLVKQVTLALADGTLSTSHNGGVTVHDGLIYVCDSHSPSLRVFSTTELMTAQDRGTIHEIGCVSLAQGGDTISPAFVEAGPDGLIVGEFYNAGSYETPVSHYVGSNHALAVVLPYDGSELGVSNVPTAAYSLPDKAQGVCFDELGPLYVSESWGASFSNIEMFDAGTPTDGIDVLGAHVPLTILGDANRVYTAKIAPMAEEIAVIDGKLYVNCESASRKYFFGLLNGAQNMYATDLSFYPRKIQ